MLCSRHHLHKIPRLLSRNISDSELYEKLSKTPKPQDESPKKNKTSINTLGPCLDLIKQHDYEHYLCVCLAPLGTRFVLFLVFVILCYFQYLQEPFSVVLFTGGGGGG